MPNIILADGKKLDFTESITGLKIAEKISKSLMKQALVMSVDGELKDLEHEIKKDSVIGKKIINDMNEGKFVWIGCRKNMETSSDEYIKDFLNTE